MPDAAASSGSGIQTMSTTSSVPKHVQTATYLWSSTEIANSPSKYAPYLTYGYAKSATQAAAMQSAGIKSMVYTNPIMPSGSSYDYTELKSVYPSYIATNCSGYRITVYKGTGNMSDPRKSGAYYYYNNVVSHDVAQYGGHADYVFVDNASSVYYNVDNAPPCGWTASAWGSAIDSAVSGVGHKVILNSLNVSLANIPTYVNYLRGGNVAGGMFEECYNNKAQWYATEEAQLLTVALLKSQGKPGGPGFWCYRDITNTAGSYVIPERLFDYASFLLTYDPNYSVFQESFTSSPSTFQVFPETGLVPLQPQINATHYTDLKTSTGAYVQRYGACYYRGSSLGPCEVAVNPSTTSYVSVPNSYAHSMVISGGGVLDGGSVSFSGPPVTSLAPQRAAILFNPPTSSTTTSTSPSGSSWGGTVTWMGSDGSFFLKTSSGSSYHVFSESYTTWSNKSAMKVGEPVTVGGYVNNNGNIIASSIVVGSSGSTTTSSSTSGSSWGGTVTWMGSDGSFFLKTSSGSSYHVFPESYTAWSNKSAMKVGEPVTVGGYVNNNGNIIASSIVVGSTTTVASTTTSGTTRTGTVDYMKSFSSSGGFQMKTSAGYLMVYQESYTTWYNKSALSVGASVTATGYINNNGALIASSISVS